MNKIIISIPKKRRNGFVRINTMLNPTFADDVTQDVRSFYALITRLSFLFPPNKCDLFCLHISIN